MMNAGGGRPFTPAEHAEQIRRHAEAQVLREMTLPKPGRVHLLPAAMRMARKRIEPIDAFIPTWWPVCAPEDSQASTCDFWISKGGE